MKLETVTEKDILDFFINFINYESLGKIDNAHLVRSDLADNYA